MQSSFIHSRKLGVIFHYSLLSTIFAALNMLLAISSVGTISLRVYLFWALDFYLSDFFTCFTSPLLLILAKKEIIIFSSTQTSLNRAPVARLCIRQSRPRSRVDFQVFSDKAKDCKPEVPSHSPCWKSNSMGR